MRSISRVYLRWKQAWQSEQRLHQQKHRALLFWALELQKKVTFDHRSLKCPRRLSVVFCQMVDLCQ